MIVLRKVLHIKYCKNHRFFASSKQIEIETKFKFRAENEERIKKVAVFQGEKTFADTYYDTKDYFITSNDIWLRKRASTFECKVPMNNSTVPQNMHIDAYDELITTDKIIQYLQSLKRFPVFSPNIEEFFGKNEISPFGTIITTRRKYKREDLIIDLDFTGMISICKTELSDFGYCIGEVEIMISHPNEMEMASKRISEFCKEFDLDTSPPIYGKVLKYLITERPQHFRALVDCGLIERKTMK